jgi:hypothetical protein
LHLSKGSILNLSSGSSFIDREHWDIKSEIGKRENPTDKFKFGRILCKYL